MRWHFDREPEYPAPPIDFIHPTLRGSQIPAAAIIHIPPAASPMIFAAMRNLISIPPRDKQEIT